MKKIKKFLTNLLNVVITYKTVIITIIVALIATTLLSLLIKSLIPFTIFFIFFMVFIIFWNSIGIKIVKFFKKIISNNFLLKVIGLVLGSGVVVLLIVTLVKATSCNNNNQSNNSEIKNNEVFEEETTSLKEEETTSLKEEETTSLKEEETTSLKEEETTSLKEEETTTEKSYGLLDNPLIPEVPNGGKKPVLNTEVSSSKINTVVKPTVGKEETTTSKPVYVPTLPTYPPKEESSFIEPSNPFEDSTTTTEETTSNKEEETTSNKEEETTSNKEEETTTIKVTPKTDISVSYTSGATVANVLVTFDSAVDAKFKISFDNVETNNYTVNKNSDTSYSIKVTVPSNYLGRLLIRVFDDEGNELKQKIKIINNQ